MSVARGALPWTIWASSRYIRLCGDTVPVVMILAFKDISYFGPMNVTRVESGALETMVGMDNDLPA